MKELNNKMNQDEKLEILQNYIEQGVEKIFNSPIEYKKGLDMILSFPDYTFRNMILIETQMNKRIKMAGTNPYVKGYKSWKEMDVNVIKGAEALYVLAPRSPLKMFVDEKGISKIISKASEEEKELIKEDKLKTFEIMKFRPVPVFHYTDTDLDISFLHQDNINSESDINKSYAVICDRLKENSINVYEDNLGEIRGKAIWYADDRNEIYINNNLSEVQKMKTLFHEVAHIELKHGSRDLSDCEKELEAESMAYLLCREIGIDSEDYSFKYLAGYSSDKTTNDLIKSLDFVKKNYHELSNKYILDLENEYSQELER